MSSVVAIVVVLLLAYVLWALAEVIGDVLERFL